MIRRKILIGLLGLFVVSQSLCAQANEIIFNNKKQLEEQVIFMMKKYEGLGLSPEQLAEKVASDLIIQAKVCQGDEADEEEPGKGSLKKKLLIGAAVVTTLVGIGYYFYKKHLKESAQKKQQLLSNVRSRRVVNLSDGRPCYTGSGNGKVIFEFTLQPINGQFEWDQSEPSIGSEEIITAAVDDYRDFKERQSKRSKY